MATKPNLTVTAALDLFLEDYRRHDENTPITTEFIRWWAIENFEVDLPNATLLYRLNQYVQDGTLSKSVSRDVKFEYEFWINE